MVPPLLKGQMRLDYTPAPYHHASFTRRARTISERVTRRRMIPNMKASVTSRSSTMTVSAVKITSTSAVNSTMLARITTAATGVERLRHDGEEREAGDRGDRNEQEPPADADVAIAVVRHHPPVMQRIAQRRCTPRQ